MCVPACVCPQIEHSVIKRVPLFCDGFMMFDNRKSDKEPLANVPSLPRQADTRTRTQRKRLDVKKKKRHLKRLGELFCPTVINQRSDFSCCQRSTD